MGIFAQFLWPWASYFSLAVVSLMSPVNRMRKHLSQCGYLLGNLDLLLATHRERQMLSIFDRNVSICLNFPRRKTVSFSTAHKKKASCSHFRNRYTIAPTQNILFNACCLWKSQGHHTPSRADSFHCIPFLVGVRANVGDWWLDNNLAPWMVCLPNASLERTIDI